MTTRPHPWLRHLRRVLERKGYSGDALEAKYQELCDRYPFLMEPVMEPNMLLNIMAATQHILGIAFNFNEHLLKLHAFGNLAEDLQQHGRKEVKKCLRQIAAIRLKPEGKPGAASWYFDLLYRNWSEGAERENTAAIMALIADWHQATPTTTPEAAAAWLRDYHTRLGERLSRGEDVSDMVPSALFDPP